MRVDLVRCAARGLLTAISLAIALYASRPGSVYSQPPASKYDADTLADRRAAIAAVLKAGGRLTARLKTGERTTDDDISADEDFVSVELFAATKTDALLEKLASLSELQSIDLTVAM